MANFNDGVILGKSTSKEGTVQDTVIHEENDIQRAGMTPNTAKRTADNLITSTLADLKDTETSNAAGVKPRLKSQVVRRSNDVLYDRKFEHFKLLAGSLPEELLDLYENPTKRSRLESVVVVVNQTDCRP